MTTVSFPVAKNNGSKDRSNGKRLVPSCAAIIDVVVGQRNEQFQNTQELQEIVRILNIVHLGLGTLGSF
jgi:hypothetical protein